MKIGNILYWIFDRIVGANVVRCNIGRLNSDVGTEVVIFDAELIQWKVVDEAGSGNGNSFNKDIKVVQGGCNARVGDVIWYVLNRGVSYRVDIAGIMISGVDDEYNLCFFGICFDGLNYGIPCGLFAV